MANTNFPEFYCQLKRLDPIVGQIRYNPDSTIIPPATRQDTLRMFVVQPEEYYEWTPQYNFRRTRCDANYLNQNQYIKRSSSMLWDRATQEITTTNKDCTVPAYSTNSNSWQYMRFSHQDELHPEVCVSLVLHGTGDRFTGVPASTRWTYLLPDRNIRNYEGRNPGRFELAGEITLALGLIAFSARPNQTIEALNATFRPGAQWQEHQYILGDNERYLRRDRGFVINVWSQAQQSAKLQEWCDGLHRGIFR